MKGLFPAALLCVVCHAALPVFCQRQANSVVADFPDLSFKFSKIDVPGSVKTRAHDINSQNSIVGLYNDPDGNQHGFVLANKKFVTIDFPGSVGYTSARRINKNGVIVGAYLDSSAIEHGFVLENRTFTKIDFSGASSTGPYGINDLGVIVGFYVDAAGATHGFSLNEGRFHTIDAPGFLPPPHWPSTMEAALLES